MRKAFWAAFFFLLAASFPSQKALTQSGAIYSTFSGDSAYRFIQEQLSFGSRAPGMPGHDSCAEYIIKKLRQYDASVVVQKFEAKAYNGDTLRLSNIIASYNPHASERILLAAHWDTRPFADKDSVMPERPIPGANDGASGVAVALEIARMLGSNLPADKGVDLIFFDGEDYGPPAGFNLAKNLQNAGKIWWCLGSQHWAKNPHRKDYEAEYGILLDMVGRKGARFFKEGGSMQFAKKVVNKVWKIARKLGHGEYFVNKLSPGITDDHIFVNRFMKIPTINIIDYEPGARDYFPDFHHTHRDDIAIIDKSTLQAVGETVAYMVYHE